MPTSIDSGYGSRLGKMARQGSNMSHQLSHDRRQYNIGAGDQFQDGYLHPRKFSPTGPGITPDPTDTSSIAFRLDGNIDPALIGLANSTDVNVAQIAFDDLEPNQLQNFAIRSLPQEGLHPFMVPSQSSVQSSPWINGYHGEDSIMDPSDLPQYTQRPNSKRFRIESGYGSQQQYSPSALSSSPRLTDQQGNAQFPPAGYQYAASQQYSDNGDSTFESAMHNPNHLHPTSAQRGSQIHNEASPKLSDKPSRPPRRQEKKHPCPQCGAVKSFTTTNDLDRHMKTVHGILKQGARIYVCRIDSCSTSTKIWPRLDNFKQHVTRMHGKQCADQADNMGQEYDVEKHGRADIPSRSSARSNTVATPSLSHDVTSSSTMNVANSPRAPSTNPHIRRASQGFSHARPRIGLRQTRFGQHARSAFEHNPSGMASLVGQGQYSQNRTSVADARRPELSASQLTQLGFSSSFGQHQRNLTLADRHTLADPEMHMERMYADQDETMSSSEFPDILSSNADFAAMGGGLSATGSQITGGQTQFGDAPTLQLNTEEISNTALQGLLQGLSAQNGKVFAELLRLPSESRKTIAGMLQGMNSKSTDQSGCSRSVPSKSSSKDKHADGQKHLRCDVEIKGQNGERKACLKPFDNKSELRKHRKRHQRIYGCTFDHCYKRFGTKWEWKRHEHKQHNQAEIWRCQVTLEAGKVCALIFHDEVEIRKHLRHQHFPGKAGADDETIKVSAEGCRLAKKWLGPYWCGFCKDIIKQSENMQHGRDMVKERDIHVSSHIDRGTHVMDQWVEVQGGGKTKGQMRNGDESDSGDEQVADEDENEANDPQTAAPTELEIDTRTETTQTKSRLYMSDRSIVTQSMSPITPIVQVTSPHGQLLVSGDPAQGDMAQQGVPIEEQEFNQDWDKICCNCGYVDPHERASARCPSCEHMLFTNPVCGFHGWS